VSVGVAFDAVAFPTLEARVRVDGAPVGARESDLSRAGGVLVRMMPPGSLEQVVFRMDALHRLEALGTPVLNPPRAVETAVDKYLALARLDAAGLPVPPTWTGESADEGLAAFAALGGDVVVKPLFGSEGRGLVRVSDLELARRTFRTLERLGAVLYVQRTVRHPGHDVRVFVLGGRVLGAIRRHAACGDWRTNVAVGGRAERMALDSETEALALRAAQAVGARMAGIDLLPDLDTGRLVVIEVNAVPGWRALSEATGVDVAAEILAFLRDARR
jgi:ribosomal protein S6--L-glutamate ligase